MKVAVPTTATVRAGISPPKPEKNSVNRGMTYVIRMRIRPMERPMRTAG